MNPVARAAIKADPTIPADRKAVGIAYFNGQAKVTLPKLLVTQAEAARCMAVSRQTFWRWVSEGLITPVEIGGVKRYRMMDLTKIAAGA